MLKRLLLLFVVLVPFIASAMACESYDPPPKVEIIDLQQGVLQDSRAPLVLFFGMPVDPETLTVRTIEVRRRTFRIDCSQKKNVPRACVSHELTASPFLSSSALPGKSTAPSRSAAK